MRSVYVSAESVIAWLGPADYLTAKLTTMLETVNRELNNKDPRSHDADWMARYPDFWYQANEPGALANLYFFAYSEFKQRPYWKRIWTLQEMVFAKRLLFLLGSNVIDYKTVLSFHYWLNSLTAQSEVYEIYPFISRGVWAWLSVQRTWHAIERVDNLRTRRIAADQTSSRIDLSIIVTCADLIATDAKTIFSASWGFLKRASFQTIQNLLGTSSATTSFITLMSSAISAF
jgi:hypothetical protein